MAAVTPLLIWLRGSVKSNIGHLEGGSGIAGIIKTVLVLEKGIIPPLANFETLNSKIDADFWHLTFPTEPHLWPTNGLRRASVNSFGFGGSNAHWIMEDAYNFLRLRKLKANHGTSENPSLLVRCTTDGRASSIAIPTDAGIHMPLNGHVHGHDTSHSRSNGDKFRAQASPEKMELLSMNRDSDHSKRKELPTRIFVWSAADENGLSRLAETYSSYFSNLNLDSIDEEIYLKNLAYTLASRKTKFPWKSFVLANSLSHLRETKKLLSRPVRSSKDISVAFVFTGQGAQYHQMGLELYAYPVFKGVLDSVERILQGLGCSWSLVGGKTSLR